MEDPKSAADPVFAYRCPQCSEQATTDSIRPGGFFRAWRFAGTRSWSCPHCGAHLVLVETGRWRAILPSAFVFIIIIQKFVTGPWWAITPLYVLAFCGCQDFSRQAVALKPPPKTWE